MLALICSFALADSYRAVAITSFPTSDRHIMAPYTWAGVLLDGGAVGGYHADSTGVHGESFLAKPFVVVDRKRIWLPLSGNEYGRVFGGRGAVLVGAVSKDGYDHPAMWKPNPTWAKAKLSILSQQTGWAQFVAPSGAIWMRVGKEWRSTVPSVSPIKIEHLDLYGADTSGRLFGNLFDGYGEGYLRIATKPAVYNGHAWTNLPCGAGNSRLTAVNDAGAAVGSSGMRAALWRGGNLSYLPTPSSRFSEADDINNRGEIVGYFSTDKESHACVWKNGRYYDLFKAAVGENLTDAVGINSSGQIVAVNDRGEKLFLLTPN